MFEMHAEFKTINEMKSFLKASLETLELTPKKEVDSGETKQLLDELFEQVNKLNQAVTRLQEGLQALKEKPKRTRKSKKDVEEQSEEEQEPITEVIDNAPVEKPTEETVNTVDSGTNTASDGFVFPQEDNAATSENNDVTEDVTKVYTLDDIEKIKEQIYVKASNKNNMVKAKEWLATAGLPNFKALGVEHGQGLEDLLATME